MAPDYLTVLIFVALAVLVPALLIISSMLINLRKTQNKIATGNFESAERPIGVHGSIMTEYFHYFTLFVAFELVVAIVLAWAYVSALVPEITSLELFLFLLVYLILQSFVWLFVMRGRGGRHG